MSQMPKKKEVRNFVLYTQFTEGFNLCHDQFTKYIAEFDIASVIVRYCNDKDNKGELRSATEEATAIKTALLSQTEKKI